MIARQKGLKPKEEKILYHFCEVRVKLDMPDTGFALNDVLAILAVIVTIVLAFIGFPGIYNRWQEQKKGKEFESQIDSLIRNARALSDSNEYKETIGRYDGILTTISPKKYPNQWGDCQISLVIAYHNLSLVNNKEINVKKGIQAYREALKVYKVESYPIDYATTQNNLGIAYGTLSEVRDKESNLEKAIEAYREALKVRTVESYPIDYATTQNNLGNAYRTLAVAWYNKGTALKALGRTIEADAAFTKAKELGYTG